jgi:transcriptional regulator with XRE-family HTH domain
MKFELQKALDKRGVTQYGLAKQLGVGQSKVNDWARGRSIPHVVTVIRISRILGVSVDELFPHVDAAS